MTVFASLYPDVDVPAVTVTEFALRNAEDLGEKPALIDGVSGATVSYAALARDIDRAAAGLRARGFAKGDVLAIYSPNSISYPVAFHGVARAGGIVTTVNPLHTAAELAGQLRDAGARLLVTTEKFLDHATEAAAMAGGIEEIFTFDAAPGATPFSALLEGSAPAELPGVDPATDLVALPYSSGTTGGPKGVMLTHRNLVANMVQLESIGSRVRVVGPGDTLIAVLPFFHIYGLLVIMNYALARGASIVVLPRFDLEEFLGAIERHRVTYAHLVPPILLALAKQPAVDRFDLSSLAGITCGAAPLGEDLAQAVEDRIGCVVSQGYGLTETSPVTHHAPSLRKGQAPHGSIGPSLPNTEVRIVDVASGADLGTGEPGELWIRGPQVMAGYLNNPEATAAAIDAHGWFRTGDIGYVDENGFCYIVDRVKELIKYKGFQVAPAELEAILLTHPRIADAAVVRSPDAEAGEVPKAYIVANGELSPDEVMDFVAGQVSPEKKIRRVEFTDRIPKSPSGKILRRVLIEQELDRAAADGSPAGAPP